MQVRTFRGAAALISILGLAACNRDQDRVYHVAKDDSSAPESIPAPAPEAASPVAPPSSPPVTTPNEVLGYQVPTGWQEKAPGQMRVASFTAVGADGQSADIGVIPLPIVGRDLELINMWRSQVQLPPTSDPAAADQSEPVTIGDGQGRLFEFVSASAAPGKSRQRVFVARLTRGGMSWFFRMTGDDAFVTSQKEKFLQLLKSVSFPDNAPGPIAPVPPAPEVHAGSIWTVPPDWQPVPPAQFLLAEYSISGADGVKAEVNVAELDGDGGGALANLNRWRGQIGLGPLAVNDLPPPAAGGQGMLVDFSGVDAKTGAPVRLVGAIVALNGQTWFYKLLGDPATVARQKDAFTQFIQTANYANAR